MELDFSTVLREPYSLWLWHGFVVTIELFTLSWLIAFVFGTTLVLIRTAPLPFAGWLVASYVELARNIPLLVQVLFWYFAMPLLLPDSTQQWINQHGSEFILATCALGFCLAAYFSESLRSGIRAIPPTQFEAGRALGFGYVSTMRYIILPQAFRATVPPMLNNTLLLFKNTSVAMAIGVHELIYQARAIDNDTFRTFEIFAVATVIYLIGSVLLTVSGDYFERRMNLN